MNLKEAYHNQGENQLKYIDNDIGQMVNENTGYLVTVGSDSYQNLAGWTGVIIIKTQIHQFLEHIISQLTDNICSQTDGHAVIQVCRDNLANHDTRPDTDQNNGIGLEVGA